MMMRAMGQITERPRGELAEVKELTIAGPHGHQIPARLYRASLSNAPAPLLIYYHGGGWVIGDLETHDPLCAEIARVLGMTVLSVDYRLAPEHRFPAATEDCLAVTEWAAKSPAEIGHKVTGIVPAGDSAGGNLAAVVAQQLHGRLACPILAQWLIYPGVDMTALDGSMDEFAEGYLLTKGAMLWFMEHYAPEPLHAYASPLHQDAFHGQPPAMVFVCGLDPLRDQGRAYAAKLISHGVRTIFREADGQIHGCLNLRQALPSAQADLLACLKDLRVLIDEAIAAQPALQQAAE
jgi:acetyl esterase